MLISFCRRGKENKKKRETGTDLFSQTERGAIKKVGGNYRAGENTAL